jgi:hypothetical protein
MQRTKQWFEIGHKLFTMFKLGVFGWPQNGPSLLHVLPLGFLQDN